MHLLSSQLCYHKELLVALLSAILSAHPFRIMKLLSLLSLVAVASAFSNQKMMVKVRYFFLFGSFF